MHTILRTKEKILPSLFLALIITAAYVPTFSGKFILDDRPLVKDNLFIREFAFPLAYLFHEDGVGMEGVGSFHTGYYRPLINILYTIDYKIWGMKPLGFRVTNLILHLLTCITLYGFLITLEAKRFPAFAIALLFGLHPVNTESVAWVSSRNNILVTLFSLISFICYVKAARESKIWARVVSYVTFFTALLSKEFAIMLLPIWFFYNRLIPRDGKAVREEILAYVPYVAMLLFYFILRTNAIGSVVTPIATPDLGKSIYFAPFLILYNLKLILLPYGLHSYIVHYPDHFISWQGSAGFMVLILLAILLWKERYNKNVLFSLFSFLLALFPVLNIIQTSSVTLISMRWLYFPMTFLCISLVFCFSQLLKVNRVFLLSGLSAVIIYFGIYSCLLNKDLWHDEDAFFRQEVLHFKNHFYVGGLAESLYGEGDLRGAERYFLMAIKRFPNKVDNYLNYSALLIETGRLDDATLHLEKVNPLTMSVCERGKWFNNRGMVYFQRGENRRALHHFMRAVSLCPKVADFWANLGGSYGSMGDYRNSVSVLLEGLSLFPDSEALRKNLGVSYYHMGEYSKAVATLEEIPLASRRREPDISILIDKAKGMLRQGP